MNGVTTNAGDALLIEKNALAAPRIAAIRECVLGVSFRRERRDTIAEKGFRENIAAAFIDAAQFARTWELMSPNELR
jgi:class 3 adenylate cyclase